jgi:hypothetical protein
MRKGGFTDKHIVRTSEQPDGFLTFPHRTGPVIS